MNSSVFSALVPGAGDTVRTQIAETLRAFGESTLRFVAERGAKVRPLSRSERYADASPALVRLRIDVDAWPTPPAGLFVVEERTIYLRSLSPMTVAHEFGHALDCALGEGIYLSGIDPHVRDAFRNARRFVTPYAAAGLDEYFAESVRAFVGVNDPSSRWPQVSRAMLRRIDPSMFAVVDGIFQRATS